MDRKVFFTSDLHIGHANVITYDNRPFANVDEMNEEIIRRWNSKVGKGDTVYILGDFIWSAGAKRPDEIIRSLNGTRILIRGNHDGLADNALYKRAMSGIKDYDDIKVTLEDGTVKRCILSHYYIPLYNGHRHGAIHLHGHSHVTEEAAREKEIQEYLDSCELKTEVYNVGCMYYDYYPVTLDEIIAHGNNGQ